MPAKFLNEGRCLHAALKAVTEPLPIIMENYWRMSKVCEDWGRTNITTIMKKLEKIGLNKL